MKSILISVMLIIVVAMIYNGTAGGPNGTKSLIRNAGEQINGTIQSINP